MSSSRRLLKRVQRLLEALHEAGPVQLPLRPGHGDWIPVSPELGEMLHRDLPTLLVQVEEEVRVG